MDWRPALDRPETRFVRLAGVGVLAVVVSVAAARALLPLAARGLVRVIELVMNAFVWLAMSLSVGMSAWSVLGVVGRTLAGLMVTRQASALLTVLVVVAALAAYGLQRLLAAEEESSK